MPYSHLFLSSTAIKQEHVKIKFSLGVDGLHDFNFVLTQLHLLEYHKVLAGFFRVVAFCIMIYSLGYMFVLAFFRSEKKKTVHQRFNHEV